MSGRKSYTRQEEKAFARHVGFHRLMRICQAGLIVGGIVGAMLDSVAWLFWAGLAAWIFNKAIPPNDELDRISER
jgi:hypothetical protein